MHGGTYLLEKSYLMKTTLRRDIIDPSIHMHAHDGLSDVTHTKPAFVCLAVCASVTSVSTAGIEIPISADFPPASGCPAFFWL